MNKILFPGIVFLTIVLIACATDSSDKKSGMTDTLTTSVETLPPNTDYKPAFPGQTRILAVKTKTPFVVKVITNDLNKPWGIVVMPDGRLLITEKHGIMKIVKPTGEISNDIVGIPTVNSSGQGGLLGLALDPDFLKNRIVYWAFSLKSNDGNLTAIAKGKLSANEKQFENVSVIYKATPAYKSNLHYGSRIVFDKSGNLIFSTGERSDRESRPQAQYLNSSLGKIIRITKDGLPAEGNPFKGNKDARPELYSYGHRNVQGLAFHPVTGDLWENEFGPKGGDELNLIIPGKNYGWPLVSYGLEYSGAKVGEGKTHMNGLEQPVYYWDPVLSPSGMTFYKGDKIPEWKNNLFICGLSSSHIARIVIENNKVTGEERLLEKEGQRFRDIADGGDGSLYAITDEGRLYIIGKN